jgi:hypothetical protein
VGVGYHATPGQWYLQDKLIRQLDTILERIDQPLQLGNEVLSIARRKFRTTAGLSRKFAAP